MHLSPIKILSGAAFDVAHLPGIGSRAFVKIPMGFFLLKIVFHSVPEMHSSANKISSDATSMVALFHGLPPAVIIRYPSFQDGILLQGNSIRYAVPFYFGKKISLQIIFKTISSALICVFCGKYFVSIQRRVCCCALPVMEAVS
jgi:hypothetical protein